MNILVTGISGFIGSHVAAALAARGHAVTGTYRSHEPRSIKRYDAGFDGVKKPGGSLRAVRADISNRGELVPLLENAEAIINIAGFASDWGGEDLFYRANVLPVEYILDWMSDSQNPPSAFIQTSSISVHGFGRQKNSSEEGPYYPLISHYQRSKLESEELIAAACEKSKSLPPTGIIRPGNVYGPGDTTTMYPMLDAIKRGKMGLVDRGLRLTCPVFIDDLVSAYVTLLDVLTDEQPGSALRLYNITGDELINWKQLTEHCSRAANLPPVKLAVPAWLARIAAGLMSGAFRLAGSKKAPDLTPYRIQQVSHDYHFIMDKARRELGWEPKTDFAAGIEQTAAAWGRSR